MRKGAAGIRMASAQIISMAFSALSLSVVFIRVTPSIRSWSGLRACARVARARDKLVSNGTLTRDDDGYQFAEPLYREWIACGRRPQDIASLVAPRQISRYRLAAPFGTTDGAQAELPELARDFVPIRFPNGGVDINNPREMRVRVVVGRKGQASPSTYAECNPPLRASPKFTQTRSQHQRSAPMKSFNSQESLLVLPPSSYGTHCGEPQFSVRSRRTCSGTRS
jgi:hypothetical protein